MLCSLCICNSNSILIVHESLLLLLGCLIEEHVLHCVWHLSDKAIVCSGSTTWKGSAFHSLYTLYFTHFAHFRRSVCSQAWRSSES
jgi:hypothetical protein